MGWYLLNYECSKHHSRILFDLQHENVFVIVQQVFKYNMMKNVRLTIAVVLILAFSAAAQAPIKIVRFENNVGIIDRGEQDGVKLGDVFEVNRQAGNLKYWVGRVEVTKVRAKLASVKVLVKADNTTMQKGDILELRKSEYDPMLDKLNQSRERDKVQEVGNGEMNRSNMMAGSTAMGLRPVTLSVISGITQPIKSSSASYALNMNLQVVDGNNRPVQTIDMTRAYSRSLAFQAFFALPLTHRLDLNLNYAYVPLNLKGPVSDQLLALGLEASATLMKIGAGVDLHYDRHWDFGASLGVFLPQVNVSGATRSLSMTERQWGITAHAIYNFSVGSKIWLKSMLAYNAFLDEGPVIQYFTIQIGPCFTIGR